MRERKALTFCAVLLLLILLGPFGQDRRNAAGQTPQPTPPPDPRYAEGYKLIGEATRLYAEHTPESMKTAVAQAEKARRLFNESSAPHDEAMTLLLLSYIYSDLEDEFSALRNGQLALPLLRKVKDKKLEILTLELIGKQYEELEMPRKELETYKQALQVYRELGDREGEATKLGRIWRLYRDLRENRDALDYLKQALSLYKTLGKKDSTAAALNNLGTLYWEMGEQRQALEYLSQALPLMRELDDRGKEATTLFNLSRVYEELGEEQKTLEYAHPALSLYNAVGDQEGAAMALLIICNAHLEADEPQKALEAFNQLLPLKKALKDRPGEALSLFYIGKLYEATGEGQKALETFKQALQLYKELGDKEGVPSALERIGEIYDSLGDKRTASEYFDQALSHRRAAGDRLGEVTTLGKVGEMYHTAGEAQSALSHLGQALLLARKAGDKSKEAQTLGRIASVYDGLGERQKALEYLNQALRLTRAAGDRDGEATVLNDIGKVYDALGEPPKAFEHFNRALALHRALKDKTGEATTLNNIGMLYVDLGEKQKALNYLTQALEIYRGAGQSPRMAAVLGNMALISFQLSEEQKAFDYANQALQLYKISGNKAGEGQQLSNIGFMYLNLGKKQKGTDYLTQALPLRRLAGDKSGEAATLYGLSILAYAEDEHEKAVDYLHRALLLKRAAGDRGGEAENLSSLGEVWHMLKNPGLATFYSKQAVTRYQELRGAMRGIDRASQQSFLRSVQSPFRLLVALLLEEGRLAEAHQVFNIFKDQEFYDAIRPGSPGAAQARRLELTPRERAAAEMYQAAVDRVAAANRPLIDLEFKLKNRRPTADEERQLRQLRTRFEAASREAEAALKQIEGSFKGPASEQDKLAATSDTAEMQATLRELSEQTKSPTVALYTLGMSSHFYVLLVTQDKLVSVSTPFSPEDFINGIVGDRRARRDGLWRLLQTPFYDPRPQAREIYDIVFKPIEKEIKLVESEARKQNPGVAVTIMWSLDSYLRYIPVGALYDGEHYLAERYRNVVFTRANRGRMTRPVSANWVGLGFGSTLPRTVNLFGGEKVYDALPGAELELSALFGSRQGEGIMPGQTWLDEQFTREAFLTALKQRRPLVHLASHFTFEPGDEARSFLLLGGDEVLTLEEMKTLDGLFTGVELLTLSACNTGAQRSGSQGREVDGFAELAQRLGAGAVLATLWPVSDAGTPELMAEFYRLRQEGQGMTKAGALREAQMALLKGTVKVTPRPANGRKGGGRQRSGGADIFGLSEQPIYTPRFQPDPKAPFAHPYYWAPFVLFGNVR